MDCGAVAHGQWDLRFQPAESRIKQPHGSGGAVFVSIVRTDLLLLASANDSIRTTDKPMKHYRAIAIAVVVAIVILAALWLRWPHHSEPNESLAANPSTLVAAAPTTVATTGSAPSRMAISASLSNVQHVAEAYKQGLINKGEAMVAMEHVANSQPQEMYGRVIDQYGQPVAGAAVTGTVMFQAGWTASREEPHTTQTDGNGEFQFTGLYGWKLAVAPSKSGYELGRNITAMLLPASGKTSPSDRAIFTMWKLKGSEPMTHANIHAYIPCDGTIARFDLLTGKKSAEGDLIVRLTRKPVDIERGKPFDWSVTLEVPGGPAGNHKPLSE